MPRPIHHTPYIAPPSSLSYKPLSQCIQDDPLRSDKLRYTRQGKVSTFCYVESDGTIPIHAAQPDLPLSGFMRFASHALNGVGVAAISMWAGGGVLFLEVGDLECRCLREKVRGGCHVQGRLLG